MGNVWMIHGLQVVAGSAVKAGGAGKTDWVPGVCAQAEEQASDKASKTNKMRSSDLAGNGDTREITKPESVLSVGGWPTKCNGGER